MPIQTTLTIKQITHYGDTHRVVCEADCTLPKISAGQFAQVQVPNKNLRRPLCVYDNDERTVTFIVASVGSGTKDFVDQKSGEKFFATLPLGNGFEIDKNVKKVTLLGGGTGCAPLLKIAKDNKSLRCTGLLGFPTQEASAVYQADFDKYCDVKYCTDDGSFGYHGFPTELLTADTDCIFVCGAPGLMRSAQKFCISNGVKGYASVEQRMGCGVGACLVCSVKINRAGQEKLLRACKDGPVFDITEIVL